MRISKQPTRKSKERDTLVERCLVNKTVKPVVGSFCGSQEPINSTEEPFFNDLAAPETVKKVAQGVRAKFLSR